MILFLYGSRHDAFTLVDLQNAVREGCRYAVTSRHRVEQDRMRRWSKWQRYASPSENSDNPNRIHVDYYSPASPKAAITTGGKRSRKRCGSIGRGTQSGVDDASERDYSWTVLCVRYHYTLNVRSSDIPWRIPLVCPALPARENEMRLPIRRLHEGERGNEIVEFALVASFFAPMLLCTFVVGMNMVKAIA